LVSLSQFLVAGVPRKIVLSLRMNSKKQGPKKDVKDGRNSFPKFARKSPKGKRSLFWIVVTPSSYGPMAWYLEEFKDLHPVVIPGVSCFNAANAALRKSITSGTETRSVVLTSRRDIEKMSAHHPTMVIFTTGTEFNDLITRLTNPHSNRPLCRI
jgi:hypothetical protein